MAHLDWSGPRRTGPPQPCRLCRRPAMCRDDQDRPCHKVCAEAELDRKARTAANRRPEGALQ